MGAALGAADGDALGVCDGLALGASDGEALPLCAALRVHSAGWGDAACLGASSAVHLTRSPTLNRRNSQTNPRGVVWVEEEEKEQEDGGLRPGAGLPARAVGAVRAVCVATVATHYGCFA